jgi:hypothetical protein
MGVVTTHSERRNMGYGERWDATHCPSTTLPHWEPNTRQGAEGGRAGEATPKNRAHPTFQFFFPNREVPPPCLNKWPV